jgi:hypothetical protein
MTGAGRGQIHQETYSPKRQRQEAQATGTLNTPPRATKNGAYLCIVVVCQPGHLLLRGELGFPQGHGQGTDLGCVVDHPALVHNLREGGRKREPR